MKYAGMPYLPRTSYLCSVFRVQSLIVGVFNGEGPPVPIPNTAVKLTSADNTCLETDREDRSTPTQSSRVYSGAFSRPFALFRKRLMLGNEVKFIYPRDFQRGGDAATLTSLQIWWRRELSARVNVIGVFNDEGPPVPIPNTAVKLISADNTCLETGREDRSTPI